MFVGAAGVTEDGELPRVIRGPAGLGAGAAPVRGEREAKAGGGFGKGQSRWHEGEDVPLSLCPSVPAAPSPLPVPWPALVGTEHPSQGLCRDGTTWGPHGGPQHIPRDCLTHSHGDKQGGKSQSLGRAGGRMLPCTSFFPWHPR